MAGCCGEGFRGVWGIAFFWNWGAMRERPGLVEKDKVVQGLDPYPSSAPHHSPESSPPPSLGAGLGL